MLVSERRLGGSILRDVYKHELSLTVHKFGAFQHSFPRRVGWSGQLASAFHGLDAGCEGQISIDIIRQDYRIFTELNRPYIREYPAGGNVGLGMIPVCLVSCVCVCVYEKCN